MGNLACDADFGVEARQHALIGSGLFGKELDGNGLRELEVVGAVDFAHAAAAQETQNAVTVGQEGAGGEAAFVDGCGRRGGRVATRDGDGGGFGGRWDGRAAGRAETAWSRQFGGTGGTAQHGETVTYCIRIIVGQAVGQAIAFRGLSCFAEAQTLGVGRPILAAAGFSRLPALPSPATSRLPHFFMRFRGPKAPCNRRQKPIICSTFDARPTFDSHARAACQRISRGTSSTLATPRSEEHTSELQ